MAPAGVKSPFAANAELLKQAPRRVKPQVTELTKVKNGAKEMDDQMKALQNRIAFLQQQSGMADRSIEEAKRKTREVSERE